MNKILKKALVLCTIVLLAATNSLTSLAQSRIQPNVYSPEFPDAYIETSKMVCRICLYFSSPDLFIVL